MKIKMTGVLVKNPVKAFEFYTGVLGFKELMYMPEASLAIVVSPEDPDGTALLLEPCGTGFAKEFQEKGYAAGLPSIIMGVEDVQGEYERLLNLGVVFKGPPVTNEWGTQATFDDTCGNYIQIHK